MTLIHGKVFNLSPALTADGTAQPLRLDPSGAAMTVPPEYAWLQQASYFRATSPTPGTGISAGLQAAFSDTANVLLLQRNDGANTTIIPHYIRLICTVAPASATSSRCVIAIDNVNRYASGGTDLTPQIFNMRGDSGDVSQTGVLRYACTAAGAVSRRIVANMILKTQAAPCWVVGDEVRIVFGNPESAPIGLLSGGAPAAYTQFAGLCMIRGVNASLLVHMWNPAVATTAPSWEIEYAWWEL